jgi:hypothetical protein
LALPDGPVDHATPYTFPFVTPLTYDLTGIMCAGRQRSGPDIELVVVKIAHDLVLDAFG